jgi:hypothetical protein
MVSAPTTDEMSSERKKGDNKRLGASHIERLRKLRGLIVNDQQINKVKKAFTKKSNSYEPHKK